MSATPSFSPRPRDPSHLHSSSRSQRPAIASRANTARTPGTIAQSVPLPPSRAGNELRTPFQNPQEMRTQSPNYFGLAVDPSSDCLSSSGARLARDNWSPPTSNVRSTAATSPKIIPVDANPAFEAFRKQSENNHRFNLGSLAAFDKSGAYRSALNTPPANNDTNTDLPSTPTQNNPLSPRIVTDIAPANSIKSPPLKRGSPKRLLSSDSSMFPDRPRRNSPASFTDGIPFLPQQEASFLPDSGFRPSLPVGKSSSTYQKSHHRAETLPTNLPDGGNKQDPVIVTPQHVVGLMEAAEEEILLLDLRVSTQYARSRIAGALNLCIPTTLLKRASFNTTKLAETFKDEDSRKKFEGWKNSKYIIVYDADSVQLKDASTCLNTLKKFANEGWSGCSYIIRGGFIEFSDKFPQLLTGGSISLSDSGASSMSIDNDGPSVAPVIGGCPMPATKSAANPFFGNIRQNMDLIGGVGQMSIKRPSALSEQLENELPAWLRQAIDPRDNGKAVSDKFLKIEKLEQRRMQEALSSNVVYGTPSPGSAASVKIAGIEKGSKNRYNSIWPYEHSRVKLQGVIEGGCDYVNASHIQASWSNRRYIATQGPLPATFNDFWEVVWQQNVRVIVMLTAEQEGGLIKAHDYWTGKHFGHMRLNFLSEHRASLEPEKIHRHKDRPRLPGQRRSTNPINGLLPKEPVPAGSEQPYVIVRKFTLSHSDYPFERMREITQLQYSSWPDFGAPAHPAHLLGLVEQCDAVVRSTYRGAPSSPEPPGGRPILVHCSAGCGRTGTFCTVDTVIDMLRRQRQDMREKSKLQSPQIDIYSPTSPRPTKSSVTSPMASPFFPSNTPEDHWVGSDDLDLVEKTVEEFRHQRLSMVQSLRQFVLCYETVLEWLVEQHPKTA